MGNISEILQRMAEALGVATDTELAKALDVPRSTLGNWRRRATVPYEECVAIAQDKGISLDWLITGAEPKFRTDVCKRLRESASSALAKIEEELGLLVMEYETDEDETFASRADAIISAAMELYGAIGPAPALSLSTGEIVEAEVADQRGDYVAQLSKEEQSLISAYRAITRDDQRRARAFIEGARAITNPGKG